jgi:hypothetical protein
MKRRIFLGLVLGAMSVPFVPSIPFNGFIKGKGCAFYPDDWVDDYNPIKGVGIFTDKGSRRLTYDVMNETDKYNNILPLMSGL